MHSANELQSHQGGVRILKHARAASNASSAGSPSPAAPMQASSPPPVSVPHHLDGPSSAANFRTQNPTPMARVGGVPPPVAEAPAADHELEF